MGDISTNFSWHEFNCHDGTPVPGIYKDNIIDLVTDVLQPLRDVLDVPIKIISGYRTSLYNRNCGGVENSQHLLGRAADIDIQGMTVEEANYIVRGYMMGRRVFTDQGGGVGWYKGFTHVDIRDGDGVAFWDKT